VKEGFSGITVQLRRRADLVPNLVEAVKGYASHEREGVREVSKARAASVNAGTVGATAQADAQLTGMLGRLFAVAEAIPSSKPTRTSCNSRTSSPMSRASFRAPGATTTRPSAISIRRSRASGGRNRPPDGLYRGAFYQDEDPSIQSAPKVSFERPAGLTMHALRRALLALLLLAAPAAARADERILHYWSDVQVQKDASLEVTETIDVRAEHDRINHGIFRDFPTRYRNRMGGQVRIGFTFEGATLDGSPVQASTSPMANGVRIKIGDPDKYVDVGEHRYVIRYRATARSAFSRIMTSSTGMRRAMAGSFRSIPPKPASGFPNP
jgi:LemA protein